MELETIGLVVMPALALLFYRFIDFPDDRYEHAGELSLSQPKMEDPIASRRDAVPERDAAGSVRFLASMIVFGALGFAFLSALAKHR
jgi:hypothetical protein